MIKCSQKVVTRVDHGGASTQLKAKANWPKTDANSVVGGSPRRIKIQIKGMWMTDRIHTFFMKKIYVSVVKRSLCKRLVKNQFKSQIVNKINRTIKWKDL
jgi:hypothetical protein